MPKTNFKSDSVKKTLIDMFIKNHLTKKDTYLPKLTEDSYKAIYKYLMTAIYEKKLPNRNNSEYKKLVADMIQSVNRPDLDLESDIERLTKIEKLKTGPTVGAYVSQQQQFASACAFEKRLTKELEDKYEGTVVADPFSAEQKIGSILYQTLEGLTDKSISSQLSARVMIIKLFSLVYKEMSQASDPLFLEFEKINKSIKKELQFAEAKKIFSQLEKPFTDYTKLLLKLDNEYYLKEQNEPSDLKKLSTLNTKPDLKSNITESQSEKEEGHHEHSCNHP